MAKVEIFWRPGCAFCVRVKSLFENKGIKYVSYNIWEDEEIKKDMHIRVPNAHTVPQVFIGGKHIGGFDDTVALEESGELDTIVSR